MENLCCFYDCHFSIWANHACVADVRSQEDTPEAPTATDTPSPEVTETPFPTETETATPTVALTNDGTQTVTPSETLIPSPSPTGEGSLASLIEIQLRATPETIKADGKITIHWEVLGIEKPDPTFTLQLSLPINFESTKNENSLFDSETRIISMPLSEISGSFHVQATGEVTEDAVFNLALFDSAQTLLSTNNLIVPLREKFEVNKNGGEVTARDGELKVKFNANALKNEDIEVEIGNPLGNELPYSLSGKPFEITAKTKKDGLPLTQFDEEVEFTIDLNAYDIPVEQNDDIYLYWYDPKLQVWSGLLSWVDDETNTLHGYTNHFSTFDIGYNNWKANRTPTVDAFQVANFTGAGTYSLPIELPAGPGGFQPNLSLTYNSQVVDNSTILSSPGWVGMGWSLDTGSIQVTNGSGFSPQSASIQFNGVSTEIIYTSQGYRLANENFMKVEFNGAIWKIWDKQGSIYEFSQISGSQVCGQNGLVEPFRWSLSKITNVFGKSINYTYFKETKVVPCYLAPSIIYDTAIYPDTLTYADDRIRVRFALEIRSDYNPAYVTDQLAHNFEKKRLDQILVEQDFDGNGVYETLVKKYDLTYATTTNEVWPNVTWGGSASPSTLTSVTEYGTDGTTHLPSVSFTYTDAMHLTRVDNGYGGAVIFEYSAWYYPTAPASRTRLYHWDVEPLKLPAGGIYGLLPGADVIPTKPGGAYYLGANFYHPTKPWIIQQAVLSLNGGPPSAVGTNGASAILFLPATNNIYLSPQITPIGGAIHMDSASFSALTTIYRVTTKTIQDGNGHSYAYLYSYTGAAVNDNAHSYASTNNQSFTEKYSEFRGHATVTETSPDGVQTITSYHQDDVFRGMAHNVQTKVGATLRNMTISYYSTTELPGFNVGTKWIRRYWTKLDATENYIYNNSGGEVGRTKTAFTYESTYGNLLTQNEQSWNGSTWSTYRSTTNYYWFNNSATRYLVSLIGKTKVFDAGNNLLAETLYLYDNNTGAHAVAPIWKVNFGTHVDR